MTTSTRTSGKPPEELQDQWGQDLAPRCGESVDPERAARSFSLRANRVERLVDVAQGGAHLVYEPAPAPVSDTLRMVRLNRRKPRCSSSLAIALLSALVDMPRSSAAALKEPLRLIARTASKSVNLSMAIILKSAIPHLTLSRLST